LDKDKETWYWGSIKIKGFTPEKNPGDWKCKIYISFGMGDHPSRPQPV